MQRLILLLTILVTVCIMSPVPGSTYTMDTEGEGKVNWPDRCNAPFMESHTIGLDGKTGFKFRGQCFYSTTNSAWNEHYSITATWDGSQAKEIVTMKGETGTAISVCPSDPWLNKVTCQKQSTSGGVFQYYKISGLVFPLTANALKDDQRTQLKAELEAKKREANCFVPVVLAPAPGDILQVQSPASVRISIKHGPDTPPKDWVISWAPLQKPGEWPAQPIQQNISLSNLTTKNGITTGTLNTSKVGRWTVISKVYIPSYCNMGIYAVPGATFTVIDRFVGQNTAGDVLKEKWSGPKTGTTPNTAPNIQQKQSFPPQQRRP